ncbi:MAG: hypothetical protein HC796_02840 [Synechococcaceae cyanobacterium RL_1_2]|nr:hypothetical protein [Synechococcaceae cyanobacterium RL_1_2]
MAPFLTPWHRQPKSRTIAIMTALIGSVTPIAGIHKLYLGQYTWGIIYFLLDTTPIPRIACAIEAVWYLVQGSDQFNEHFKAPEPSSSASTLTQINIPNQIRDLEQLRLEGLITEYEFEQKRRQLLEKIQ